MDWKERAVDTAAERVWHIQDSQGLNLALVVLFVPYSLDSGFGDIFRESFLGTRRGLRFYAKLGMVCGCQNRQPTLT